MRIHWPKINWGSIGKRLSLAATVAGGALLHQYVTGGGLPHDAAGYLPFIGLGVLAGLPAGAAKTNVSEVLPAVADALKAPAAARNAQIEQVIAAKVDQAVAAKIDQAIAERTNMTGFSADQLGQAAPQTGGTVSAATGVTP